MADPIVQQVKDTADITDIVGERVALAKAGTNLKGLCPFHSENTPSFIVSPARQTYHCFGCGEGGDIFSFIMKFDNLSFPEALQEIARRYNIALPEKILSPADTAKIQKRQTLQIINEKAAAIYHDYLLQDRQAEAARNYLKDRNIPAEVISRFKLGFAPESWDFIIRKLSRAFAPELLQQAGLIVRKDRGGYYDRFRKRILFPIFDVGGKVVGFGGRIIGDGQPKYLNTDKTILFDKGKTLFGLYQNKDAIRQKKQCLLVEGNFDLLALAAYGVNNAVAPLGTALTQKHVRLLKGYADQVILLFDGDSAGLKAALRSVPLFLTELVTAKVATLPPEHDPDSFVCQYGADHLHTFLSKAQELPDFVFDQLLAKHGPSIEGKARIIQELGQVITALDDSHMQRTLFINHFSKKLSVPAEKLASVNKFKKPKKPAAPITIQKLPIKHRQLLEFLIGYPQYHQKFRDAGIDDIFTGTAGDALIKPLLNLYAENSEAGPERLLDAIEGPIKRLLSELLATAPQYEDEIAEQMAQDMVDWLKTSSHKLKKQALTKQINEAQQANDTELLLNLMKEKKKLDQELTTENSSNL